MWYIDFNETGDEYVLYYNDIELTNEELDELVEIWDTIRCYDFEEWNEIVNDIIR